MAVGVPLGKPGGALYPTRSTLATRLRTVGKLPANFNTSPKAASAALGEVEAVAARVAPRLAPVLMGRIAAAALPLALAAQLLLTVSAVNKQGRGRFYTVGPGPYTGPIPWWNIPYPGAVRHNGFYKFTPGTPTLIGSTNPWDQGSGLPGAHADLLPSNFNVWLLQEDVGPYFLGGRAIRQSVFLDNRAIKRGWVGAYAADIAVANPWMRPDWTRRHVYQTVPAVDGAIAPWIRPNPLAEPAVDPLPSPEVAPARGPLLALSVPYAGAAGSDSRGGRGRPTKGEREYKMGVRGKVATAIVAVVNAGFEAFEQLEILALASGWAYDYAVGGSRAYNQANYLFVQGGIGNIDLMELVKQEALNEIEDRAIGYVSRRIKNLSRATGRPVGVQAGWAL